MLRLGNHFPNTLLKKPHGLFDNWPPNEQEVNLTNKCLLSWCLENDWHEGQNKDWKIISPISCSKGPM